MQDRMIRLGQLVGRRRKLVVAIWLVVVAAALPLTMRQNDNLTGGGFDVPGSQSKAVADAIERDFADLSNGIAVLFLATGGDSGTEAGGSLGDTRPPTPAQAEASLARLEAATATATRDVGEVRADPRQQAAAK